MSPSCWLNNRNVPLCSRFLMMKSMLPSSGVQIHRSIGMSGDMGFVPLSRGEYEFNSMLRDHWTSIPLGQGNKSHIRLLQLPVEQLTVHNWQILSIFKQNLDLPAWIEVSCLLVALFLCFSFCFPFAKKPRFFRKIVDIGFSLQLPANSQHREQMQFFVPVRISNGV